MKILLVLVTVLIAGCTSLYTSNGEYQYLLHKNGQELIVPKPLTSSNLSPFYILPEQKGEARVDISVL